jgi:hypothetical protein
VDDNKMTVLRFAKVVANLPATLEPNTLYLVRVGSGFDIYVSDLTGNIAYSINGSQLEDTIAGNGLTLSNGVPPGFADYEYPVPMRGDGFLHVVVEDSDTVILFIAAFYSHTPIEDIANSAVAPNAPTISSQENGAVDIGGNPTISISGFNSPIYNTFNAAQFQISTTDTFLSPIWDSGWVDSLSTTVPRGVLQTSTTYYLRARVRDSRGFVSTWSEFTSFTTREKFALIIGLVQTVINGAPAFRKIDRDFNDVTDARGTTWFDNHPTYAGIVPQVIDNQVMMKIPKFYFKVGTVPSGEFMGRVYWMISDLPEEGFSVHPAFIRDNGIELNQIWVGEYQASYDGSSKAQSIPGVAPMVNIAFTTAQSETAGW